MPPKTVSTLADMLSDGSDVDMVDARDENAAPSKKAAKAPARKPRKTKPASKRLSGSKKRAVSKTTQRAPLTDRSNEQRREDDTEEVDEFIAMKLRHLELYGIWVEAYAAAKAAFRAEKDDASGENASQDAEPSASSEP